MRVAIDTRKIHDFGIGTYIRNLLRHLSRLDHTTEYVLLARPEDREALKSLGENFRTVAETAGNYSISEQMRIPLALKRERVTLFHAPHYVLPPLVRCKSVVTIHDCIHLMFPQYLPNRAAYAYARASMWAAARRSDRILTVSEASKRDILHFFNVKPEKIVVVYNAIDEHFWQTPPEEDVARVRERYQLDHQFVLYVGNIKPHKNLVRLIEAFAELRQGAYEDVKLLIIGDEISKLPALRRAAAARPGLVPGVRRGGLHADRPHPGLARPGRDRRHRARPGRRRAGPRLPRTLRRRRPRGDRARAHGHPDRNAWSHPNSNGAAHSRRPAGRAHRERRRARLRLGDAEFPQRNGRAADARLVQVGGLLRGAGAVVPRLQRRRHR